mmetsp:Transcript_31100/g.77387  ORF Transcript_31100/g.77387 Transcript_31100/m.77387 type:complete len:151 (-) Transcript_31100:821-1273(-)
MFGGGVGDMVATGAVPTEAFDAFGVGMVLLRLAVPALHDPDAMARARLALEAASKEVSKKSEFESALDTWAASPSSEGCDFELLNQTGAWSLIEGLTAWNPKKRMTLGEALKHPSLVKKTKKNGGSIDRSMDSMDDDGVKKTKKDKAKKK